MIVGVRARISRPDRGAGEVQTRGPVELTISTRYESGAGNSVVSMASSSGRPAGARGNAVFSPPRMATRRTGITGPGGFVRKLVAPQTKAVRLARVSAVKMVTEPRLDFLLVSVRLSRACAAGIRGASAAP